MRTFSQQITETIQNKVNTVYPQEKTWSAPIPTARMREDRRRLGRWEPQVQGVL